MDEFMHDKSAGEIILDNKEYIYPALFYIAGLLLGSFCYNIVNNSALSKLIETAFASSVSGLFSLFLNRFSLYFSVYVLCVFLGMCLIGFPFINIVPLLMGCEIAIKTAHYYVNFGVKGVGFAMLMIIPEGAAIATILIFSIKNSNALSKDIFSVAAKGETTQIDIKRYFRRYLIYGLIVCLTALINALASYLLGAIIKI